MQADANRGRELVDDAPIQKQLRKEVFTDHRMCWPILVVMTSDEALVRSYELGMGDDGWIEAVMEEADRLLPILVEAGYARIDTSDETRYTWSFTRAGVARYEVLMAEGVDDSAGRHDSSGT